MELPLRDWLDTILKIVNAPDELPGATRLRKELDQMVKGKLTARGVLATRFAHSLPPLNVSIHRNKVLLTTGLAPSTEVEAEEAKEEGELCWIATRHGPALQGAIIALLADRLGTLVRRCDHCGLYFVLKRNHRRQHHFCCEDHRRAFDHVHRDPTAQAEYMRKYRAVRNRPRSKKR
jgi:hypothetical protein